MERNLLYGQGWQEENTLLHLNVVGWGGPQVRMGDVGFASITADALMQSSRGGTLGDAGHALQRLRC